MPTRLLQVSDCHLSRQPGTGYRGHDPDANLDWMLDRAAWWRPDWLVLTGDLAEDASPEGYRRIVRSVAACLDGLACRVAWIPGNHDDRRVMAPLFDAAGFEPGPVLDLGEWQLALLDSARPDDPAGTLDAERLEPLARLSPDRPAGVFVHHQPLPVGAAWIDKVGMRESEHVIEALAAHGSVRFVAFGHVHQRFRLTCRGIEWLACPATAANTVPATEHFTPGEVTPLARWFVLDGNGFRSGYLAP